MNRNTFQSYNATQYSNMNPYKTATQPFRDQGTRSPLYPIGPTLTQPEFKPIQRGVSPYVSRQGMMPPSYQQRYMHQSSSNFMNSASQIPMGKQYNQTKVNYEQRQRDLIARNEAEIDAQHKKREQIRVSYQRQINTKSAALARNLQRKQRLIAQLQTMQHTYDEMHQKLMSLKPPTQKLNTYEPMDRKQQQMIITKNKLITQMRDKEEDLHKQEQEEQKYWENEILQKQKILLKIETELNAKRTELNLQKNSLQKPDFASIEDQIRQNRYNDFIFAANEIESKINRLTQQRQRFNNQVRECLTLKKPQLHNLRLKHEDLVRQRQQILLRSTDLQRIGKQMEQANNNLMNEVDRKEEMITKYELDIQTLKSKKIDQENAMNKLFNQAREDIQNQLMPKLSKEITEIQQQLRFQQSTTTRLKTQYQRLYELLCSATTKNLHQTFNNFHSNEIRI